MGVPETRYAITPDGVYLAYQTVGEGPIDLVWQFDLDLRHRGGHVGDGRRRLSPRALIIHPADPARSTRHGALEPERPAPNLENSCRRPACDPRCRGDQAARARRFRRRGSVQRVVRSVSAGARVHSLVWEAPAPRNLWAPDYPWGDDRRFVERFAKMTAVVVPRRSARPCRTPRGVWRRLAARARGHDGPAHGHTASPDVALMVERIWNETDVRAILPSVSAPTLLLAYDKESADSVASPMPNAEVVRLLPALWDSKSDTETFR